MIIELGQSGLTRIIEDENSVDHDSVVSFSLLAQCLNPTEDALESSEVIQYQVVDADVDVDGIVTPRRRLINYCTYILYPSYLILSRDTAWGDESTTSPKHVYSLSVCLSHNDISSTIRVS